MCISSTDKVLILVCISVQHEWCDLYRDRVQHERVYIVLSVVSGRVVVMVLWRIQGLDLSAFTVNQNAMVI